MPNDKYITLEGLQTYRQEDKAELDAGLAQIEAALTDKAEKSELDSYLPSIPALQFTRSGNNYILDAASTENLQKYINITHPIITSVRIDTTYTGLAEVQRWISSENNGNFRIVMYVQSNGPVTSSPYYYIVDVPYTDGVVSNTGTQQAGAWDILATGRTVNDALANIAPTYSIFQSYEVGDVVIYTRKLYKCTTAIPSSEAWNAAHWQEVTVVDLINQSINSAIGGKY